MLAAAGGRLPGLAVGGAVEDLGDAQAVLLVDDDDLAARDGAAVDEQVGGLAGEALERDDGADAQVERLADGHVRTPDLDAELHRDLARRLRSAS